MNLCIKIYALFIFQRRICEEKKNETDRQVKDVNVLIVVHCMFNDSKCETVMWIENKSLCRYNLFDNPAEFNH